MTASEPSPFESGRTAPTTPTVSEGGLRAGVVSVMFVASGTLVPSLIDLLGVFWVPSSAAITLLFWGGEAGSMLGLLCVAAYCGVRVPFDGPREGWTRILVCAIPTHIFPHVAFEASKWVWAYMPREVMRSLSGGIFTVSHVAPVLHVLWPLAVFAGIALGLGLRFMLERLPPVVADDEER